MQRTSALLGFRWMVVVVVLLGGLFASTRAHAQAAQAQVQAGDALMAQGAYRAAAAQYEAAYSIDPVLPILERMADAYRLAGDAERANILYQRIAAERGGAPPPQGYIAPTPLPQTGPLYTTVRPVKPPGQAMLNAGIGLLSAGYGAAIFGGAIGLGVTYTYGSGTSWAGASGMLFIPVFGPFATLAYRRDVYWAVPWAVLDGAMQLSGLGLIIAGAVIRKQHSTPRRASLPFDISPYAGANGTGLSISGTF